MLDVNTLEVLAIRAMRGDDTPAWPAKTPKDKKEYWRRLVLDIASVIEAEAFRKGYKKAQDEEAERIRMRDKRAIRNMNKK